jgi:hypothetical protein
MFGSCRIRRFEGTYLHLQGENNHRFPQNPHGNTFQMTTFFIVTDVKTSNLTLRRICLHGNDHSVAQLPNNSLYILRPKLARGMSIFKIASASGFPVMGPRSRTLDGPFNLHSLGAMLFRMLPQLACVVPPSSGWNTLEDQEISLAR